MSAPVCYILSNINKALAFEWIAEKLNSKKFELHFILLNPGGSVIEDVLQEKKVLFSRVTYHGKKDIPKAVRHIYTYLKKNKIQVVHCHLFDASITGLLAAKLAGVEKRIYTRHHSTLHHQFFPRAVYYDRFINSLATDIVAISENVKNILIEKERVPVAKIHLIHHGFPLEDFENIASERINAVESRYNPMDRGPVIGVISRFTNWKGIQYIIPAFKKVLQQYPNALLVLANAKGDYATSIQQLLCELPIESYQEIIFETDVAALYQLFDIFIHVPINPEIEAFGQTYVEALAAGIPSVFTLSGIASEFIIHEENALVVSFQDSDAIYQAIIRVLENQHLREKLKQQGRASVQEKFALEVMIQKLEALYNS